MYLVHTLSHHAVYLRSILTLSSHILLGFQPVSSGFTTNIVDTFLFCPMRATSQPPWCHHNNTYLTMNTNHESSCNAMLYCLLLPPPSQPTKISSAPCSRIPQPIFFPSRKAYIFSTRVKQSTKLLFSALNYVRLRWQLKEKNYQPVVPDIQQI